ncbi:MAG: DUF4401 domain-containing protein [Mariniphaga sp.]
MKKEQDIRELLDHLQQTEGAGFEFDEAGILGEVRKNESEKASLATKVLSIAGGFIATLSFLGFIFAAGMEKSEIMLLFTGLIFIGGAIYVNKEFDKLILDTFAISAYVMGFLLLGFGMSQFKLDWNVICVTFILISFATLFITQGNILSFISVIIVSGSFISLIISNKYYNLIHLYNAFFSILLIWSYLNEAKIITWSKVICKLYNPVRTGLIFSLIIGLFVVGKRDLVKISPDFVWLSSIVTIPILFYLIYRIMQIIKIRNPKSEILIYGLSALILLPTAYAPAVSGALLILLVSFFVNYKTGIAIGIIATAYFITQYYYDLNLTLLVKSLILFSTGILFLLFYFLTNQSKTHEKV